MGPRDQTQTRRTIHSPRKNLRIVTVGTTRTGQIRQRTPGQGIHPSLEEPLRRTILLYQKERRKATPGARLSTPERVDNSQSLPATPHPTINQPRSNEETL